MKYQYLLSYSTVREYPNGESQTVFNSKIVSYPEATSRRDIETRFYDWLESGKTRLKFPDETVLYEVHRMTKMK